MVEPTAAVEGVGEVTEPTPPTAAAYHSKLVPVALSAAAVAPWQYITDEVTVGAAGVGFTVTVIAALGPSQVPVV